MDTVNSQATERFAILARTSGNVSAAGQLVGDWVEITDFRRLCVMFVASSSAGAMNATLFLDTATSITGTGAQEVINAPAGSVITSPIIVANYNMDRLKGTPGRQFFRAKAGGNTSNVTVGTLLILGFDTHFSPASLRNVAGVFTALSS